MILADIDYADVGRNTQPGQAASSQPGTKRSLHATLRASSGQTQTPKVPGQAPKMLALKAVQVQTMSADAKLHARQSIWVFLSQNMQMDDLWLTQLILLREKLLKLLFCFFQDFQVAGGFAAREDQDKPSAVPAQKHPAASQNQDAQRQQQQQQRQSSSKATSGLSIKPSKAAQAEVSKSTQAPKKPQQVVAVAGTPVKASSPVVKPVSQASASAAAAAGQLSNQAQSVPSQALPASPATQMQPAKPSQPLPAAAAKPGSHLSQAQPSLSNADAPHIKAAESTVRYNAAEPTLTTHAKVSQAAAAAAAQMVAASVADEWADKGVPVQSGYLQSGYHMSDSPLPEDEEPILERDTFRPLSVDRQLSSADPEHAAPAVPLPDRAARASEQDVPSPVSQQPSHKDAPQAKVLLPAGMNDADAATGSKGSLLLSADSAAGREGDFPKRPPNRQSSSSAAAAPVDSKGTAAATQAAAKAKPTKADRASPSGRAKPLAQAGLGLSRLSVSSLSNQTQPAEPSMPSRGVHTSGGQAPNPNPTPAPTPKSDHATQLSNGLLGGPVPSAKPVKQGTPTAANKDFSSRAAETSKPKQQKSSPKESQQQPAAAAKCAQPVSAVKVQPSLDLPMLPTQSSVTPVNPSAPRQTSAALSSKASTPSKAATAGLPQADSGKQQQASQLRAQPLPVVATKPEQKLSGVAGSSAVITAEQLPLPQSAHLSQPDSGSKPNRQSTSSVSLQSSPQELPIPVSAFPEGPVAVPALPPQPSHALPPQGQAVLPTPSPWAPPPPAEAPPQPLKVPADPYPPEPSSPRPSAAASPKGKKRSRSALQQPLPPSDSGEDMEIDEEPVRETLPPLPTEPFPQGLELASVNSNQELMDISSEERDSLLHELSSIRVSFLKSL